MEFDGFMHLKEAYDKPAEFRFRANPACSLNLQKANPKRTNRIRPI